ncbi:hypothetical protein RhiLY_08842 [Ceratobasidium sp. AG-Ba]|nr:hypothetical protein RhiLY_08842 [Ceratobasidium sp. AG-Ba]
MNLGMKVKLNEESDLAAHIAWLKTPHNDVNVVKAKVLHELTLLNGYSAELNDKAWRSPQAVQVYAESLKTTL